MLLILAIFAEVLLSGWPFEGSNALHAIFDPISLVDPAIFEFHYSFALPSSFFELADIDIPVAVEELSVSALLVELIQAFEFGAILPRFLALAVSLVVFPISFVLASANR